MPPQSIPGNNGKITGRKNYIYKGHSIWANFVSKRIVVSKNILRMGTQKTPIQKTYEIVAGSDSINIDFLGFSR